MELATEACDPVESGRDGSQEEEIGNDGEKSRVQEKIVIDLTEEPDEAATPLEPVEAATEVSTRSPEGAVQFMSPGFRSAAALAGWDDQALLMAALNQSPAPSAETASEGGDVVPVSPACRDRKRDTRTPLSSARRHKPRTRWLGSGGSPLTRVPMKALPLLNDSDKENTSFDNKAGSSSDSGADVQKDKENQNPSDAPTGAKSADCKGKSKEKTPSKLPCIDQLREELSCAVCLDLCFEPSTLSCGHSFCGTCLQSVIRKCGAKCPKCRQPLRGEAVRGCRINTVLWNTIQILFPRESAARKAENDTQRDLKNESINSVRNSSGNLGVRSSRLQPWPRTASAFSSSVNRINVMGALRSSFQTASQIIGDSREGSTVRGDLSQGFANNDPLAGQDSAPHRIQRRIHRSTRVRQEQVDAALAARLQQTELMAGSVWDNQHTFDEPTQGRTSWQGSTNVSRYGNGRVGPTGPNLRSVTSRSSRHRSRS